MIWTVFDLTVSNVIKYLSGATTDGVSDAESPLLRQITRRKLTLYW